MPKYTLKILLEWEARDDLDARRHVGETLSKVGVQLGDAREIVLHSAADHKSMRFNSDGTPSGEWQRGGRGRHPGPVDDRT
jgi:hypothetical protein